jgi:lipoprotein-anchoring transpeptidase ErfK/SrfK
LVAAKTFEALNVTSKTGRADMRSKAPLPEAAREAPAFVKGNANVGHKAEWPAWTPADSMIRRKPHLLQYAGGVPGGENNPLGARALYLHQGGTDTMFRIHGTNEPWLIGHAVFERLHPDDQ